jgi:hypothetical protein
MFLCRGNFLLKRLAFLSCVILLAVLFAKAVWYLKYASNEPPLKQTINKQLMKSTDLSKYKADFAALNEKHCNVFTLNSPECLKQLKEFDDRMQIEIADGQSKPENLNAEQQRRLCEYSPDGGSIEMFFHHTFFHYDKSDQKNNRMMKLNILSFLATQNLHCTKLIVWFLKEFSKDVIDDFTKMFSAYLTNKSLELRVFDLEELCNYRKLSNGRLFSEFEKHKICASKVNLQKNLRRNVVAFSDFVRFVVLDIFGGIYVDGDMVFLKDTRILWNDNFAYRFVFAQSNAFK